MGRCRIGEEEKEGEKERGCGWDRGGRRRLEAASRVRELGGRLGDGGRRWTLCQAEQGGWMVDLVLVPSCKKQVETSQELTAKHLRYARTGLFSLVHAQDTTGCFITNHCYRIFVRVDTIQRLKATGSSNHQHQQQTLA